MPCWSGDYEQYFRAFQATVLFHGWDFLGYGRNSGFRFLLESNKNGVEMHFGCDFSTFQDSNFNPIPPMLFTMHVDSIAYKVVWEFAVV